MSVGENIKRIRKANGIKQSEIADKLGVTAAAVSAAENNAHKANLMTLARIADAMDVSLIDLMVDVDQPACDPDGYYRSGDVRNYLQSEWLRMYDWLNADGVEEAKKFITNLSSKAQYQSEKKSRVENAYEQYLRDMGI